MQQIQMHQLAATPQVQYVQPVNAQAYQQAVMQPAVGMRLQPAGAMGARALAATPIWTAAPPGRGGMNFRNQNGPRQIKATEVKSYLYAWCTQKKLKPEYLYETIGKSPKIRYKCTLSIPGLEYKASEEARSKRDAQTQAAWNFCDEMVRTGYMKKKDLPPRIQLPDDLEKSEKGEGDDGEDEFGGWTIDNSRQRLNRFCMAERISCDFENRVIQSNNG